MVEERLPKALELKERVGRGEVLNALDLAFLERVLGEANQITPLIEDDPKAVEIATKMLGLYREITTQALKNEQAAGS
jgi:hypothetical protein